MLCFKASGIHLKRLNIDGRFMSFSSVKVCGMQFFFFGGRGQKEHKNPINTLQVVPGFTKFQIGTSVTTEISFSRCHSFPLPHLRWATSTALGDWKTNGQLPLEAIVRRLKINLQLALPPPPLLNTSVHLLPDKDHESAPKHILLETIAIALCCSYTTTLAPRDTPQL